VLRAGLGVQDAGAQRLPAVEDGAGEEDAPAGLDRRGQRAVDLLQAVWRAAFRARAEGDDRRFGCEGQLQLGVALDEGCQLPCELVSSCDVSGDPRAPERSDGRLVFSARKGVCSNPYSANEPIGPRVAVAEIGWDEAERVAQVVGATDERAAGIDGRAEPLVRGQG
jgi:hypothetical protein